MIELKDYLDKFIAGMKAVKFFDNCFIKLTRIRQNFAIKITRVLTNIIENKW